MKLNVSTEKWPALFRVFLSLGLPFTLTEYCPLADEHHH